MDEARANARVRDTRNRPPAQRFRQEESRSDARGRWLKGAVLVLAVAAVAAILLVAMRTCAPDIGGAPEGSEGEAAAETAKVASTGYVSPYNWENLVRDGTRWSYMVDGQELSRTGIDVSESQQWIDWQAVAADGVDFAIIRAGYRGTTEGQLYEDEYFEYNLAAAREAGLDCGVYFFSQAVTKEEAVEEADYVLSLLGGSELEYPVAFDSEEAAIGGVESRIADLTRDQMTDVAEAFCNRIQEAGYETMIYGNRYDIGRYNKGNLEVDGLWWAEYDEMQPSAPLDIHMWQYSNAGEVAGIGTRVDMNIDLRQVLATLR